VKKKNWEQRKSKVENRRKEEKTNREIKEKKKMVDVGESGRGLFNETISVLAQ
jgi:hypothetical protein